MTMTTGPVLTWLVPSEAHQEIVRKSRALGVAVSSDPAWRPPGEAFDEMQAMLIKAALPARTKVHYTPHKDVLEGLNAT